MPNRAHTPGPNRVQTPWPPTPRARASGATRDDLHVIAASFWSDFWPDFAATIIAVVLGIPAGLWLDRRAERRADKRRLAAERARTREAREQLEPVIRDQAGWFRILGAWGNLNEFYEGPLAELWMVLRGQIVASHLTDHRLFGDLAVHFERCVRLDDLVRLRSSLVVTGPPIQHQRVLDEDEAIKTRLNNMTKAEGANPEKLADRVVEEVQRLADVNHLGATAA